MHRLVRAFPLVVMAGCTAAQPPVQPAPAPPPAVEPAAEPSPAPPLAVEDVLPPAPWEQPPLSSADAPGVLLTQWRQAENRAACAPLAPVSLEPHTGARVRAAQFSGGWAIAYDLPGQRSAFGIPGTGSSAADDSYNDWPHLLRWRDGSTAGYGPEGGTGPNQLAYLRIPGQQCLYNVWSNLGPEHLVRLLEQLRFVSVAGQGTAARP
ncbi:MAG TPA: hypothetical protein VGB24_17395 [Longimicrobium sp.]|jgi:hypothetical protein|uniref:hypothetical protein n=1 Tax=Longimicrobium sp. TaxID=2029185 RepID=UPI002EDAC940